ncbi:GNAT family N-acetyltransferase [Clostridium sp. CS001]|uniref:GNAT family N-acetyltransferase n=1 Tax=Clostridium sp. CS001 TaxID=2880648 RepID=UPI001CF4ABC2|nr:GNAT family N-acetyltransferase [Clostridium sp. CS001]MCB2288932.1 GNAT family N-acetyltransferase [Clostridium sp. CS001]
MDNIIYSCTNEFNEHDIKHVYEDAGWVGYTKDLSKLMKAMKSSLMIVSAWEGIKLVGLIRVLGDGITIIYIQDILVLNSYKRKGIGSNLLNCVLDKYKHVDQKVLLTDDSEETRGFYENNGFISCDKGTLVAFTKFN